MPRRTVGLDVGTHAVRAVEVGFGRGRPILRRFGQVALPVGAVVGGEVADPPAVASALRRLWREAGFRDRAVVVGVANPRVVARTAELPAMPDEELRSSLQFQVQDLIPIPVDEAVLDYQVLERLPADDGEERLRVLIVAAHRDMLRSLLAALDGAGLRAARIDLIPFALIRALWTGDVVPGEGSEAIVGVGAGVTNVVVHEAGMPRFVRTLPAGGNVVTEAVAAELELETDEAEELKRRADPLSADPDEARAGQVVATSLTPVLEEVRGSLDFYLAQADSSPLNRVLLAGGGSRLPELAARLSDLLGVPVEPGAPLEGVDVAAAGLPEDVVRSSSDLLAAALGLALSGEPLEGGARRISLLPEEVAAGQLVRRQVAMAGAGVAAFAALLALLYVLRAGQVDDARDDAEAAEARTAALQQEVAQLQDVEAVQADIAGRRQTVAAALEGEVAWTRLLQEVATVIPNDVWLTSFQGARNPGEPGTVTMAGMGFDQSSAARWLLRVGELPSITGLWLPSSTASETAGGREVINFTSDATLTDAAESERLQRYLEGS